MISKNLLTRLLGTLSLVAMVSACSDGAGSVLFVDAEFDPATASDHFVGLSEMNPGVAQTFAVLADGKFERFSIVLNDGVSVDSGIVRVTVRPLVAGLPDPSEASSIIDPIDVDTSTLSPTLADEFRLFDVGNDPGRQVVAGETYAIVVEFVSRVGVDTAPIARLVGQTGDPFIGGTGAVDPGTGYAANTNDYFFRTFSLQPN